jgi:hypothetical protein
MFTSFFCLLVLRKDIDYQWIITRKGGLTTKNEIYGGQKGIPSIEKFNSVVETINWDDWDDRAENLSK